MTTSVTFLGTGTSVGVPVIGCECPVCTSKAPGNIRSRCSLHLQTPTLSLLVDTGPDLREQALRENLRIVDAVLYTHAHLDHIAGFDELRAFCWHRDDPLPLYAGAETLAALRRMFPWAIENRRRSYVRPDLRAIDGPFAIRDLAVTPVVVEHAGIETIGFRFALPSGQSFAYLPDVKRIPDPGLALLSGLDLLILDALRPNPHPTHMSLDEALATIDTLRPGQTILTHLAHELDYPTVARSLPPGVSLAHDGLKLTFHDNPACIRLEPPTIAAG